MKVEAEIGVIGYEIRMLKNANSQKVGERKNRFTP